MIKNPAFQFPPGLFSAQAAPAKLSFNFSSTMTSRQWVLCALYIFSTPPLTPAPVWIIITKGRWDISAAFVLPSFLLAPSPGGRGDATAWYRRVLWRRRCPDKMLVSVYRGGLHCEGRYAALTEKSAFQKRARGRKKKKEMYGRPQQTSTSTETLNGCLHSTCGGERPWEHCLSDARPIFWFCFFFVRKIAMACF